MIETYAGSSRAQVAPQVNPSLIFEMLNRYQHTMALKGAIELGVFTHIASGATTATAIAARCRASERGTRILCDFLTVLGFLRKHEGQYSLSPESAAFLDRKSPAYLGSIADFVASPRSLASFRDVAGLVRRGKALETTMDGDAELWIAFARSMMPMVMPAAQTTAAIVSEFGRNMKVLDIAAGHGAFGISIALRNPEAHIYALDLPQVVEVAMENAARAGVRDRVFPIPGSAFDADLGSGYDVVLLPNFLHHFTPAKNVELLRRVHAAMKPSGCVATLEFVPNDDRVSPPIAATFSMTMLARTEDGDAYTFAELNRMFRGAGFGESRIQGVPPTPLSLILTGY